ncbi:hypothetical protein GCM10022409_10620 [Hymenobacter glaciei]|uniref:DUF304 domain-containing protein n=1 Tax=Hymenobacter glaciei TaxID=877209 RepID=A0ABP7TM96_9BACT
MPTPLLEFRKYRLASGWLIFMYVVAPLLIALFAGMPLLWWLEKPMPLLTALYCLLPLGFALLLAYGLAEAIWGNITISQTGIVEVSMLGRRQLAWNEIKGYRISKNYLRLLPTDTRKQPVKIGLMTEDIERITAWVVSYYPNLTPPEAPESEAPTKPFASPAEQTSQVRQRTEAQQTARLLNQASCLVTAWLIFYPMPYTLAVMAGILLPLGAAVAQWLYPGQLRPDEPDDAPSPSLGVSLLLPSVGLFVRILLIDEAELVSVAAIQPWAYPVGGGFALLLVAGSWRHLVGKNRDSGQLIIILTAALLFGFSAPVAYNVAFDTSSPIYYKTRLIRKYINNDEFAGFTAVVEPWGSLRDSMLVHVSRVHYQQLHPGDSVRVRLMPGALGVAWFQDVE